MEEFVFKEIQGIRIGYFPALEALGFVNGFTCRQGGESDIVPGTLNMALHVHDDPLKVVRNRERVAAAMGFSLDAAVTCAQVHGTEVACVTKRDGGRGSREPATTVPAVDGLVTEADGLALMLFFADCVPVILADPEHGAFGLFHAGWRGSVGRIAQKGVRRMAEQYGSRPEALTAAIGPSIGPCCYEVDERVRAAAPGYEACFTPVRENHFLLDLWAMNRRQLMEAGLRSTQIHTARICTSCRRDLYFSHRAEKGHTGRLAAVIFKKSKA